MKKQARCGRRPNENPLDKRTDDRYYVVLSRTNGQDVAKSNEPANRETMHIHAYVETSQKLVEMAWSLLDPMVREEMITDQFLNGLDNHELRVQAAIMGDR